MRVWRWVVLLLGVAHPLQAGVVLFDWTKNETAGNADWVVDHTAPVPDPGNPSGPESWDGAISTWGYALFVRGHTIRTLPPGRMLTYGTGDSLDLSRVDLLILPEPQNPLSAAEVQAVLDFLQSGGGLIFLADHYASDRDRDGWDSPRIWNAAFESVLGVHAHVRGERYNNFSGQTSNFNPSAAVVQGPVGPVNRIAFHAGTVFSFRPDPAIWGVAWVEGKPRGNTLATVVCGVYGRGRFCVVGDSSPADDGTGDPGDRLYDGWNELDDGVLLLNMSFWAMRRRGSPPPPPPSQGNHKGGPDKYGYTWIDSHTSGGPQFTWYTVSNVSSLDGDDRTVTLTLPFAFPFYGQTFTQVTVGSNGVLQFGSPSSINPYSNSRLPMSSAGRMIAAFWDDLTVFNSQGSYVYYGTVGTDKFVIEWRNARRYGDSTVSYTFQVILVKNGDIYISYRKLSGTVASSTVGIQDGSVSLQVTYNGSNSGHPDAGSTIYFKAPKSSSGHQGGPDGGGYTWIDSHISGGASYLWYNRDNTWTDLGIDGDDVGKWVSLPFSVSFYGQSFSRVYVSSNGVMFFTTAANPYSNGPIPNGSYSYFLAPFWDDLTAFSSKGSRIYAKAVSSSRVVFLFENLHRYRDDLASYTFEVILDANGTVHFSYGRMSGTVASSTVGIQGGSGTGLQVTYNGSYSGHPAQGLTIRFSPGAVKGGVAGLSGEKEGVYLARKVVDRRAQLRLVVGSPARVRVGVLDALGRVVVRKDYGVMAPGVHRVRVDLPGAPAGVYFLRVEMGDRTYREKFVVR